MLNTLVKYLAKLFPLSLQVRFMTAWTTTKMVSCPNNMYDTMQNIAKLGYSPKFVLDVGAARGEWAEAILQVFPKANFCLFEPLPGMLNLDRLQELATQYHTTIVTCRALLGATHQDSVTFYSMDAGSSIFPEVTTFNRQELKMPMATLDDCAKALLVNQGPILLKLDVQGAELEVLRGATNVLPLVDVILLEAAVLEYNAGAPLIAEVIAYMKTQGFVVYDFCNAFRRQTDMALFQTDLVLVRENHWLRAKKKFWLGEP